jgi:hypothetical protein
MTGTLQQVSSAMRVLLPSSLIALLCFVACPVATPPAEGEGEGEGEGDVGEGEGEGDAGEGEGEGEGDLGEGEGEGEVPADGFGVISGDDCGVLVDDVGDELHSADPFFFDNAIDFGGDGFDDPGDVPRLTAGGQEMIADDNAGGSSLYSEVFAFEVLSRCEGAVLYKTETEVDYTVEPTKITDLVVDIGADRVGVSVVRTFVFGGGPLTPEEATRRVEGKLDDILVSSANVAPTDAWVKQILAIIAAEPEHVQIVRDAWDALDAETRADTILYVTTTLGDDAFIAQ